MAGLMGFFDKPVFKFMRDRHLAGGDLRLSGTHKTEFTATEGLAVGHAHGRAEDSARHGAPRVNVAEAGGRIERGTRCVVGEIVEARLVCVGVAEDAGGEIAGKAGPEFGEPCAGALTDGLGDGRG